MKLKMPKKNIFSMIAADVLTIIFIVVATLAFMNNAHAADTCLFDGITVDNCAAVADVNGNEPNVMTRWVMPTERGQCLEYDQVALAALNAAAVPGEPVDTSSACIKWQPLSLDEIDKVRVYFVTPENNWSQVDVFDHKTAMTVYKKPGTYDILATTFDIDGRESKPSERITIIVADGSPQVIILGPPKAPQDLTATTP